MTFTEQSQALLDRVRKRLFDFSEHEISLLTTILESSIQEADHYANTDWLCNLTGWSEQKVRRLARQGKIPGAHQSISGRQRSELKFRRSEVLSWWNTRNRL
jgi:hypothetical protein